MGTGRKSEKTQLDFRRKRVAKACHSCRVLKSKCDGTRPVCSRCKGYGYQCVYSSGPPRGSRRAKGKGQGNLHEILDEYGDLAENLASKLRSAEEQESAAAVLSRIKARASAALAHVDDALSANLQASIRISKTQDDQSPTSPNHNERYLGEVSDVQFFNLVKRVLQIQGGSYPEQDVDSYEQDGGAEACGDPATAGKTVELPSPENAKELMHVYLSTIHIAYPFIPGTMLTRHFVNDRSVSQDPVCYSTTQVALLCVICAIGSYYDSFPSTSAESRVVHDVYFQRSVSLTPVPGTNRSIDFISLLLSQCFYFLAVSRTDSCWTTLGQAIRIAQSIGLHVQSPSPGLDGESNLLSKERRIRIWYSMYVLDRLLSLQLGRPPAIHDADCDVPLPSRVGDCDIDWDSGQIPSISEGPSTGDYFLAMISFSRIIGHVLRDLYGPGASRGQQVDLYSTKQLDRQLTQWKSELPRALRFDMGHAFDQSLVYKRQRNMLAIKYHHLRALIHRPYLCYPVLRNAEAAVGSTAVTRADWPIIGLYERICMNEARAIARLFHNVSRQQDLVRDFPWWQIISCLICAGSILLVSSIFTQPAADDSVDGLSAESLADDAETCLRVFEALSSNSAGARIARDMMEKLKEYGPRWSTCLPPILHTARAHTPDAAF
ncbi:hypothetical protein V2A60_009608 [Cordyceps javanica]